MIPLSTHCALNKRGNVKCAGKFLASQKIERGSRKCNYHIAWQLLNPGGIIVLLFTHGLGNIAALSHSKTHSFFGTLPISAVLRNLRRSYRHMQSRYLNLYSTLSLQLASTHSFHGYGLGGIEDWKWHTGDCRLLRQAKLVSPSRHLRSYHKQLFGTEA